MSKVRILIADDQPMIRDALERVLESDPTLELVGSAAGAEEAVSLAKYLLPDVAVLDVRMPGGGGVAAAKGISQVSPLTRMVAFTADAEGPDLTEMLRTGVMASLEKTASPDAILNLILRAGVAGVLTMPRPSSERRLAHALVELADTLVADFDVVDFLYTLVMRCVQLLGAAEAGLMLVDHDRGLRLIASSSERARLLELFEIQNEQGPCLDCFRQGEPVAEENLEANPGRWPLFTQEARTAGFRSVLALPVRWRADVIGALNVFCIDPGGLDAEGRAVGQAMAQLATIGILQERAAPETMLLAQRLQSALSSRVVIEQAKGLLAERSHVNVDDAFQMLRTHARSRNRRLRDVAEAVIAGTIPIEGLDQTT